MPAHLLLPRLKDIDSLTQAMRCDLTDRSYHWLNVLTLLKRAVSSSHSIAPKYASLRLQRNFAALFLMVN